MPHKCNRCGEYHEGGEGFHQYTRDEVWRERNRQYQREYRQRQKDEARERKGQTCFTCEAWKKANGILERKLEEALRKKKGDTNVPFTRKQMAMLCHPDKHGGSDLARRVMQWINSNM